MIKAKEINGKLTLPRYVMLVFFSLMMSASFGCYASEIPRINTVELTQHDSKIDLNDVIRYYRDPTSLLELESIKHQSDDFKHHKKLGTPDTFGIDSATFWFKINIKNTSDSRLKYILEMTNPVVDRISFYIESDTGELNQYSMGMKIPYRERPILIHTYAIPIELQKHQSQTIFIRVTAPKLTAFPFYIYTGSAFEEDIFFRQIILGIFVGIILGLLGYNCFIYISARLPIHLYYLILATLTCLFTLVRENMLYSFFPNQSSLNELLYSLIPMVWGLAVILFFREYLETKTYFPRADKLIRVFICYYIFCLVLLIGGIEIKTFFIIFVGPAILFTTTLVYIPIKRWIQGYSPSKWFVLGLLTPIIGVLSLVLVVTGIIPNNSIFTLITNHTEVLQLMVLSVGLAEMIKKMETLKLDSEKESISESIQNRVKTVFLSRMSYLIRSPMNGVIGNAELLKGTNLVEDQRHYVSTIESSSISLLTIIDDIIEFSRANESKYILTEVPFNIATVIEESVSLFEDRAKSKSITIKCLLEDSGPFNVVGDPVRLRQILLNLLSNAFKFTESGEITIELKLKEINEQNHKCYYEFRITDTGIGISESAQKKLFTSYTQADQSTMRRYGGTGLGLNISKKLVELMGGTIGLTSTLGVGSTFMFDACFSVEQSLSHSSSSQHAKGELSERATNSKILIAGYNYSSTSILSKMLSRIGIESEAILGKEKILEKYSKAPSKFNMIYIDYRMRDFTDDESVSQIRAFENRNKLKPIPIIITSAHVMSDSIKQCLSRGADVFLQQPITLESLSRSIQDAEKFSD